MSISTGKKLLLTAFLLVIGCGMAQADTPVPPVTPMVPVPTPAPTPTTAQAPALGNSNAVVFAVQAGSIAGATQACGQDISLFVTRVNEALSRLASSPADKALGTAAFQNALQQSQSTQTNSHPLQCSQVIQDYNSLPLLRSDYQQTVLDQLNPGMTAAGGNHNQNSPAQPNLNAQQQTATAPTSAPTPAPNAQQAPVNNPSVYNPAPPSPVASPPAPLTSAPAPFSAPPESVPAPAASVPAPVDPNSMNNSNNMNNPSY